MFSSQKANRKVMIQKIATGENHCLALDVNGRVWAWGDNTVGQLGNDLDLIEDYRRYWNRKNEK